MKSPLLATACLALVFLAGTAISLPTQSKDSETKPPMESTQDEKPNPLPLGNFSVSLAVKDIKASKAFYDKLGFQVVGGKLEDKWIILQSGTTNIGLFQGMFPKNIMTFNPGWNHKQETLKKFKDVRELESAFEERGMEFAMRVDPKSEGPGSFVIVDPDGNSILFDQHVPTPK